ncbi:MAG: DNA primase [Chitinivibrionales bacterium]|nr:DNA primase [Chitinivibrionales bacterium]MBD3356574.1 DNA primase [Chitinivibrionales bacterium]
MGSQTFADDHLKEEIRNRLDIVEVVGRYVGLKSAGRNMKGLCPFHKEKTPSFTVNPERNIFHCFGCGKGGDVFGFLMEMEGLSFPEVLRMTAEETGVTLPSSLPPPAQTQQKSPDKNDLLRIHALVTGYYYQCMQKSTNAVDYFKNRGLTGRTVKDFRLGYAPPGWHGLMDFAKRHGIDTEDLAACGLVVKKENGSCYDRFRDRIIFPIFDTAGRPIAFGARAMRAEGTPKYLNSPETSLYRKNRTLYGLSHARSAIKERNHVLFVEGYMDFLSLFQAGIRNVAATSGTAFTKEHGQLIRRLTSKVVLLFDGDSAGADAARRAAFVLAPLGLEVRVLMLPGGEDPDSFVRAKGADTLISLVEERALDAVAFVTDVAAKRHGENTPQGKSAIIRELEPLLQAMTDEIVRVEYVKHIAERLGIREDLVWKRAKPRQSSSQPEPSLKNAAKRYLQTEEGSFLHLLVRNPALAETTNEQISPEVFTDRFSRELYSLIMGGVREEGFDARLLDRADDPRMREVLSLMLLAEEASDSPEQDLRHKGRRLLSKSLTCRAREITARLRRETDPDVRMRLLGERSELSRQLGALN